jgi:hypothetical protein
MGSVRHRLWIGNILKGKNGGDVNKGSDLDVTGIMTADRTDITSDSTKYTADGAFPFTADSTRYKADSTINTADAVLN